MLICVTKKQGSCGKILSLQCDVCCTNFTKSYNKNVANRVHHFCSRRCVNVSKRNGGIVGEKIKRTCIEKYGVENVFQADDVKKRCHETLMNNYGVVNPSQSSELRNKAISSWIKTFGVDHPLKSEIVKQKCKKTCLERYGVDNPSKFREIRDRAVKTSLIRTGYAYSLQNPDTLCKAKASIREKYGVDYALQSREIREKCLESMCNNPVNYESKVERRMYEVLCEIYDKNDVFRNVRINSVWPIDFYIKSTDTYVQLDGVYWHGLDRPIEEIAKHRTHRDVTIYQKWLRDHEQVKWFERQGLKLVRITDRVFNSFTVPNVELLSILDSSRT